MAPGPDCGAFRFSHLANGVIESINEIVQFNSIVINLKPTDINIRREYGLRRLVPHVVSWQHNHHQRNGSTLTHLVITEVINLAATHYYPCQLATSGRSTFRISRGSRRRLSVQDAIAPLLHASETRWPSFAQQQHASGLKLEANFKCRWATRLSKVRSRSPLT